MTDHGNTGILGHTFDKYLKFTEQAMNQHIYICHMALTYM